MKLMSSLLIMLFCLGCAQAEKPIEIDPTVCKVTIEASKGPGARIAYGKVCDMSVEKRWLFDSGDISPCTIVIERATYMFVSLRQLKTGEWKITGMSGPVKCINQEHEIEIVELMDSRFLPIHGN